MRETPKSDHAEVHFTGDPKREMVISQGEIDFVLFGDDVKAFIDRPSDYIARAIEASGRKVNALRVEDAETTDDKTRSAFRMAGCIAGKCTWVHIDEPAEHESTWICIKLPYTMLTPF
ncbi:hypothetical protein [Paracoccus salsus]|uniref:hypothetical protein n=1 Tax=Paracoccus salsus TaxID=2911061 RepID=UPI001F48A932|nr:hypothetical protein [Paracoccus salsus]MCF3972869.1 hypothetical protein [Paracoccus salsus]